MVVMFNPLLRRSRMGIRLNKRFLRIALVASAVLVAACVFLALLSPHASFSSFFFSLLAAFGGGGVRRKHTSPARYSFASTSRFSPVAFAASSDPSRLASRRREEEEKEEKELCASFPKHLARHMIQPVLKIGHSEDGARLAAHFATTSSCFDKDELLVVSDLDDVVFGHDAVDVLADLPAGYHDLEKNPHFQNYLSQKAMRDNGTLNEAAQKESIDGWILDKYKFLPMVERAWLARPGRAFYFFYEPDTYVFWDNALRFLETFDPDAPIYMGSPSPGQHDVQHDTRTWFGNGGPGVVLSRGAIKALLHRRTDANGHFLDPPLAEKWQDLVAGECCGDSVLGWALWNATVQVQGYWPMFNPHPLNGIPFSDPYWCQPVLTLHKTAPQDLSDLWHWEFANRELHVRKSTCTSPIWRPSPPLTLDSDVAQRPILYADLWRVQHPGEPAVLNDWDNGDWDRLDLPPGPPIDTPEACEEACRSHDACLQWNWRGGDDKVCTLMRSIRYGAARPPEYVADDGSRERIPKADLPKKGKNNRRWADYRSGWLQERISNWRSERPCEAVEWVGPSITRIF